MSLNERISTRIDGDLKEAAIKVFQQLGITEGEAIRMFYAQVNLRQGLPFELRVPNRETIEAMEEGERNLENLQTNTSFSEIRKELKV
ncbi:MAG: type II toxin-antitoxin system RelB/DinJ family antitoxin [Candidatus Hinthialibacter antarcticus]|nr:type II toxin-antitoxin system RelB/DinJ family antitoxin [Candidatus Hinthialibacter antarcticus]